MISFNLATWFVIHIYFILYVSSVCFPHTLLISLAKHTSEWHFVRIRHWSQSQQKVIMCETWRLFISLVITLPVRSPTLNSAPHQLPAPLYPACVCMNIDVNYLLPQNRCSICDFLEELPPPNTRTRKRTHLESRVSLKWAIVGAL